MSGMVSELCSRPLVGIGKQSKPQNKCAFFGREGNEFASGQFMTNSKRRRIVQAIVLLALLLALAACASTAQRPSPNSSPCAGGDCAAGSGVSGVQLFVEPQAKEAP